MPGDTRIEGLKIKAILVANYDTLEREIVDDLKGRGADEVARMQRERAAGRYANGWTYTIDGVVKCKFLAFSLYDVVTASEEARKSGQNLLGAEVIKRLLAWIEVLLHEFAHAELEGAALAGVPEKDLDEAGHGTAFERLVRRLSSRYGMPEAK